MLVLVLVAAGCNNKANSKNSSDSSEGSNSTAESVKLIAHTKWPDNNFTSDNLRELSEKVEQATNGKVELEVNTGGALGYEGPELLSTVRDNLIPVSDIFTSEVAGDEPLFKLTTMPFLIRDYQEIEVFYDIAQPYFEKILEEKWNQKFLFGEVWPYAGFFTKEKAESVEDMKGMKMRTYDENGAIVVEEVGASPMPMPFSEVYSALSTGVIDSMLTSSTTGVDGKLWEVLKYHVPTNVTAGYSIVTMNLDEFNKLDQETQEAILEVGKEMDEQKVKKVVNQDEEMLKILEENGITIVQPSEEFLDDLSKIGDEITNNWLGKDAPPEAQEIVDNFRKKVGR